MVKKEYKTSIVRKHWFSLDRAAEEIADFEARFGHQSLWLACHAAFPSIISPELVNLIHFNFLRNEAIPWVTEADFLLSSLCRPFAGNLFEVEPGIREILLLELQYRYGWKRFRELADFLMQYIDKSSFKYQSMVAKWTHYLIAESYLNPDSAIKKMNQLLTRDISLDGESKVEPARKIHIATISEMVADPLSQSDLQEEYHDLLSNSRKLAQEYYALDKKILAPAKQQRLSKNPFKYKGVLDPNKDKLILVPRTDELNRVINGIKKGNYWAIIGPRMIGKTTFLRQIANEISNELCVYFSFEISPTSEKNFYKWFTDRLIEQIPSESKYKKLAKDKKDDPALQFLKFLEIFKPKNNKRIILLFDEVAGIPNINNFLRIWRRVYEEKFHKKELNKYSIVLAGRDDLLPLIIKPRAPFSIAQFIYLKDFSSKESETLIEILFKMLNILIEQQAKEKLINQISGHPQMLQQVCYNLVEIAKREKSGITVKDVDDAINILSRESVTISILEADIQGDNLLKDLLRDILKGVKKKYSPYKEYSVLGAGCIVKDENYCAIRNKVFEKFLIDYLDIKMQETPLIRRYEKTRYKILHKIGEGGTGVVYKAMDLYLERRVAIKKMHNQLISYMDNVEAFYERVKYAARLIHINIVTIYDLGQMGDEIFISMEFIEGIDLKRLIHRKYVFSIQQILYIAANVFKALEFSHRRGIIHRNIKPGKIMINDEGEIKILGFDVSAFIYRFDKEKDSLFGSVKNMSPEQLLNIKIDQRTDIYSTGVTLFELPTGQNPFQEIGTDVIAAHLEIPVPSIRDLRPETPDELAAIIEKCMAKDREDRYQSAQEVLEKINKLFSYYVKDEYALTNDLKKLIPPKRVFISFYGGNRSSAKNLARNLEEDGIDIWFDEDKLRPGDDVDNQTSRAIERCAVFIPIISREAAKLDTDNGKLRYHILEWELARTRKLPGDPNKIIIPVKVDETNWTYHTFKNLYHAKIPGGERVGEYEKLKDRLLEIQTKLYE